MEALGIGREESREARVARLQSGVGMIFSALPRLLLSVASHEIGKRIRSQRHRPQLRSWRSAGLCL